MTTLKLDTIDHIVPVVPISDDKNRNGVHSLYALARWCRLPKKLILKALISDDFGFVFAAHATFDSVSACLYQSSWNSFMDTTLINHSYYTEYNNSSNYTIRHVKEEGMNSFIGHEINMAVAVNRRTRKKKQLTTGFRKFIDSMWNIYPKELKQQYFTSKDKLLLHLNELKQIKMNKINNDQLLYSYRMQLRYSDEDRNYHLNSRKYYKLIEEALMNYDKKMATNKYLNYSISIVYWKETPVTKYSDLYVNICYKNTILMKNDRNNKYHNGWDVYGVLSVCECCQRNCDSDTNKDHQNHQKHEHEWIHQTGFVLRVFDKKPTDNLTNSKL